MSVVRAPEALRSDPAKRGFDRDSGFAIGFPRSWAGRAAHHVVALPTELQRRIVHDDFDEARDLFWDRDGPSQGISSCFLAEVS